MDNTTVKKNIQKMREAMNLSQQQVADRLGISRTAYRNLEKGRTKLISDSLGKMAEISGSSMEMILLGYQPVPGDSKQLTDIKADCDARIRKMADEYDMRIAVLEEQIRLKDSLIESAQRNIRLLEEKCTRLEKELDKID